MEKIFYEVFERVFLANPVLALALLFLFSFLKWKNDEITGWLKRIESKFDKAIDELKEATRDGLKEEREYRHDVEMKQDDRIHEIQKEIGEIREKIGGR
jgi:hypothetical protein